MISLETRQTVLARNLICNQFVVDAAHKYMTGNIDNPRQFWYNYMSTEDHTPFNNTAQLFIDSVYLRIEALTGELPD